MKRTVVLHVATRSIETKDRWVSTDGRAHDIDALYNQSAARGRSGAERLPVPVGRRRDLHGARRRRRDRAAAGTRRVDLRQDEGRLSGDDDPRYTQGSLTLSTKPDLIRFTGTDQFELGYRRTVPATRRAARSTSGSPSARSAPAVAAVASEMEARATGGARRRDHERHAGLGLRPAYTLSGTTTTQGGVKSLVVNGAAVTPDADGSWSARVQLDARRERRVGDRDRQQRRQRVDRRAA